MKQRIIESIIAFIFGLVITIVDAVTGVNIPVIVLGAILAVVGIGCFIWALVDKNKEDKEIAAVKADCDLVVSKLEKELKLKENDVKYFNETNAALDSALAELQKEKDNLVTSLADANDKIAKLETQLKASAKKADSDDTSKASVAKKQSSKKTSK